MTSKVSYTIRSEVESQPNLIAQVCMVEMDFMVCLPYEVPNENTHAGLDR